MLGILVGIDHRWMSINDRSDLSCHDKYVIANVLKRVANLFKLIYVTHDWILKGILGPDASIETGGRYNTCY
jgi:hypothetical protein